MATYDRERFKAAHEKYLDTPTELTEDDLEQLAVVDRDFAERARAKRAGYVPANGDAHLKAPVSFGFFQQALQDIIGPQLSTYRHVIGELRADVQALTDRLATVEQRGGGVQYDGTFKAGRMYPRGTLVTRGGGLWLSLIDSPLSVPGTDSAAGDWKLVVKSGGVEGDR